MTIFAIQGVVEETGRPAALRVRAGSVPEAVAFAHKQGIKIREIRSDTGAVYVPAEGGGYRRKDAAAAQPGGVGEHRLEERPVARPQARAVSQLAPHVAHDPLAGLSQHETHSGSPLGEYARGPHAGAGNETWVIVISILLPFVGFITGAVRMANHDPTGQRIVLFAALGAVAWIVLPFLLALVGALFGAAIDPSWGEF